MGSLICGGPHWLHPLGQGMVHDAGFVSCGALGPETPAGKAAHRGKRRQATPTAQKSQRAGASRRSLTTRLRHTTGTSRGAEWSTSFFRFAAELGWEARAGDSRSLITLLRHTVGGSPWAEWSTTFFRSVAELDWEPWPATEPKESRGWGRCQNRSAFFSSAITSPRAGGRPPRRLTPGSIAAERGEAGCAGYIRLLRPA
jgi:hypothetical protein